MGADARIVAPIYRNQYLDGLPEKSVVGLKATKAPSRLNSIIKPFNRQVSKYHVKRFSPSVIHETYYDRSPVTAAGAKRFLTVYDMIHERYAWSFPDDDETTHIKRAAVARADHIIAISHSTKRDLCELFVVPEDKVTVVHLGFERFRHTGTVDLTPTTERPYLLYVGNRSGYKNFEGMVRAVASDKGLRDQFDIITFGGRPFNTHDRELTESLGLRTGSVHHLNGNDAQLGALYNNARALVYPSYYEGFGLPPLEAMAHDCPVVVSNTSSMPEVVGDAGEYFAPSDCEQQAQAIRNVVFDEARRDDLIAKGRERLKHFSWKRCAQETLDTYRKVLLE